MLVYKWLCGCRLLRCAVIERICTLLLRVLHSIRSNISMAMIYHHTYVICCLTRCLLRLLLLLVLNGTTRGHGNEGWRALSGDERSQNDFLQQRLQPVSRTREFSRQRNFCRRCGSQALLFSIGAWRTSGCESPCTLCYTAILTLNRYVCL